MSSPPPTRYDADFLRSHYILLRKYRPYWLINEMGERVRNPAFDAISGQLLDLKNSSHPNYQSAVRSFTRMLDECIAKFEVPVENWVAVVVPSHTAGGWSAGLEAVLRSSTNRFNVCPNVLCRVRTIDKLAHGGDRSIETHLDSIIVQTPESVRGRTVLLIDDIWTSGNSLRACRRLLREAGAEVLAAIALGKTTHEDANV